MSLRNDDIVIGWSSGVLIKRACALFVLVAIGVVADVRVRARQGPAADASVLGTVLAPDGAPLGEGVVRLVFAGTEIESSLDASGAFRFARVQPAGYELLIASPGHATLRLKVAVPRGGRLELPPIRLPPPTYLRVRLLAPNGEMITNPGIISQSYDIDGRAITDHPGEQLLPVTDAEGITTIGPLPRGAFVFLIDSPPWARTRAPDVLVTGKDAAIDRGTMRLDPGATLRVDLVDQTGSPVPGQWVSLEGNSPISTERFLPVLTDANGRATFERLATGHYRVGARALRPCGMSRLTVTRRISISGSSPARQRLALSGVSVRIRLTRAGAPLASAQVALAPDVTEPAPPAWITDEARWLRYAPGTYRSGECEGVSDRDGVATIEYVPPGPARASVRFASATAVRRVLIPPHDGELALDVPQGVAPLRIVDAGNGEAAFGASVEWLSNGAEVRASVPATGDLLLEGIQDGAATLVVRKDGYERFEARFQAPPPVLHTIALRRLPERRLRCLVQDASGQAVANGVVELVPGHPLELTRLAGSDDRGVAEFLDVPAGSVRMRATAAGFSPSTTVSVTVPTGSPAMIPLILGPRTAR